MNILKSNWFSVTLLIFLSIKIFADCFGVFLNYKSGTVYIQTSDYDAYMFYWFLAGFAFTAAVLISCLSGALVTFIRNKKQLAGKFICLSAFIIAVEILCFGIGSLNHHYFLKGFSNSVTGLMQVSQVEAWINEAQLQETDDLFVNINGDSIPAVLQPAKPRFVSVYNFDGKKAVKLSYGRGIRKPFGVIIFADNVDEKTRLKLMDNEFRRMGNNTYIWYWD